MLIKKFFGATALLLTEGAFLDIFRLEYFLGAKAPLGLVMVKVKVKVKVRVVTKKFQNRSIL